MSEKSLRVGIVVLCFVAMALVALGNAPASTPGPNLWLWAWERPEDFGFLGDENRPGYEIGVAQLVATARLHASGLEWRGQLNPVVLPSSLERMPVVRIETDPGLDAKHLEQLRGDLTSALTQAVRGAKRLQIDFDARASERPFYRSLLEHVRANLPPETRLSITALASWCLGDRWIDDLPIDEAVPMLFRMGTEGRLVQRHLEKGGDFSSPLCRTSFGVSTDEPVHTLPARRTVYAFHPRAWDRGALEHASRTLDEADR